MSVNELVSPIERVIVALDTSELKKAKEWVYALKDQIKLFKVGTELFTAQGPKAVELIRNAGCEVFLDLKFHDIPNTVAQSARAAARLGVRLFNVHASGGRQMMQEACLALADEAARQTLECPKLIAVTLLTSLNQAAVSEEIGIKRPLSETVLHYARLAQQAGLDGVVASACEAALIRSELDSPFIIVTPGIRPAWAQKGDQARVVTPKRAIEMGSDYIVIGRPITEAADPARAAAHIFEELA